MTAKKSAAQTVVEQAPTIGSLIPPDRGFIEMVDHLLDDHILIYDTKNGIVYFVGYDAMGEHAGKYWIVTMMPTFRVSWFMEGAFMNMDFEDGGQVLLGSEVLSDILALPFQWGDFHVVEKKIVYQWLKECMTHRRKTVD